MTEIQNSKTEEYVEYNELDIEENKGWKNKIIRYLDNKYFISIIIVLVAIISFVLGRVSGLQEKREVVRVIDNLREISPTPSVFSEVKGVSVDSSGSVVASKNGTKYHYPWCVGAKQISEKNKIIFNSIEAAKKAGYTPASNCKGLK